MKGDAHICRFPHPAASWTKPRDVKALCGYEMLDAVSVLDFQFPERNIVKPRTCEGCQVLYNLQSTEQREWFYGVLTEKEAARQRVNRGEE